MSRNFFKTLRLNEPLLFKKMYSTSTPFPWDTLETFGDQGLVLPTSLNIYLKLNLLPIHYTSRQFWQRWDRGHWDRKQQTLSTTNQKSKRKSRTWKTRWVTGVADNCTQNLNSPIRTLTSENTSSKDSIYWPVVWSSFAAAAPNTIQLRLLPFTPPPAAVPLINEDNGRGAAPLRRSQSTPTRADWAAWHWQFSVLPILPAQVAAEGIRALGGGDFSYGGACWGLRALLNTGMAMGSGSKPPPLRQDPWEPRPGGGRAGSRALQSRSGSCAGRSPGEGEHRVRGLSPTACPQPLPSPRPLGMGGGTRVGARGNRGTDSRSPERRRLRGPPLHRPTWGKREPPSPGVRSGKPRRPQSNPPLKQAAAAATDRALGPAKAFPSNPALPPPANGRRGRRAPLPRHVIRPAQPLVPPSDAFGLRVPAASPPRARQALGSLGHSRAWLFRGLLTRVWFLFLLCLLCFWTTSFP